VVIDHFGERRRAILPAENNHILDIRNLKTHFLTNRGVVRAVDGISFHLDRGEILGLVGESGSGKTVTSLSILRLVPQPGGRIVDGNILFKGKDLLKNTDKEMRRLRGNHLTMIPQDPMTSLNPVYRVNNQLSEPLALHQGIRGPKLIQKVVEMLGLVRIPSPLRRSREYPHQFSGGMKQRVMIAMCLSCQPDLIIADEPTTALDVTIQAQILKLLRDLQAELNTSIIFITHDLGVVAGLCSRVAVMYAGVIVELADVRTIFHQPRHPYTVALIGSVPKIGESRKRLATIEGQPPNLLKLPDGCRFSPRCPERREICLTSEPELTYIKVGHQVRCHRYQ
jgi:peptide/nickel transport system ATP-binding protein